MNYIVVAFGVSDSPGYCSVKPCPVSSYGPFETSAQAQELADEMFPWQQPHVLRLEPAHRAALVPEHG